MKSAKTVELALVVYTDNDGVDRTQLAVVGDQTVLLLNGREFGISGGKTEPSGVATTWLRDGVFAALGKPLLVK